MSKLPPMEAGQIGEVQSLLESATAAYGLHGDAGVYFVVHEVDADNRVIDHNEYPVTAYIGRHLGGIIGPEGHYSFDLMYGQPGESSAPAWLAIAKQCGSWLLANRGANVSPLPPPEHIWAIELLTLPKQCGTYIKTVWYCDAFAATVEVLRRLAAQPATSGNKKSPIGNGAPEKPLIIPTDTDLKDLWTKLVAEQGNGKADTQIADDFSKANGRKYLNRLKRARTTGKVSNWRNE